MSRSLFAAGLTVVLGCGSSPAPASVPTAPTNQAASSSAQATGSAGTSEVTATSAAATSAGTGTGGATSVSQAGASGLSGNMMMDAHVCSIPDDIAITPEDGDDAGIAPDCKNVPRKIIANNCIGGYCHDNVGPPAAGLDLMSPCVADRLVNVRSTCMDLMLLDPVQPARSFLTDKVNAVYPKCGKSMPDGGHLATDDLRCMNAWINAVLRAATR